MQQTLNAYDSGIENISIAIGKATAPDEVAEVHVGDDREVDAEGVAHRHHVHVHGADQPSVRASLIGTIDAEGSRELWLEFIEATGIYHRPCGSVHVVDHDDLIRPHALVEGGPDRARCQTPGG